MAANIFTGAVNSNSNNALNWSLLVVPTISDGNIATWNATSPACLINAAFAINGGDFTGYANTLTNTSGITCNGNFTLSNTMTITGAGYLFFTGNCVITSNGKSWTATGNFGANSATSGAASFTVNLADNWSCSGSFLATSTVPSSSVVFNGSSLTVSGGMNVFGGGNRPITGSTNFIFNGTGTFTAGTNSHVSNNLLITSTANITFSGTFYYRTGLFTTMIGSNIITTGSALSSIGGATFDTDPTTWNNITFTGTSQTHTLNSNLRLSGTLLFNGVTQTTVNGAFNIYTGSQITIANAAHLVTGTSTMIVNNACGWTHNSTSYVGLNIIFNANVTFGAGNGFRYSNSINTVTHISGLMTNAFLVSTAGRYDVSNINWSSIQMQGTNTLLSNMTTTGGLTFTLTAILNGSHTCYVGTSLHRSSNTSATGSATIQFTGTGTWTDNFPLQPFSINIDFNMGSGTIILAAALGYRTGTMRRLSGNVDFATNNNTMTINQAATTLDMAGAVFNNVIFNNTITLNSLLTVNGTLQSGSGGTGVFTGVAGWTARNFDFILSGRDVTLEAGLDYTVTNSFTCTGATLANKNTIKSSSPTVKAKLKLQYGATQNVLNCNATQIDSSQGQTIYSSAGTLTSVLNWLIGTAPLSTGNFLLMM